MTQVLTAFDSDSPQTDTKETKNLEQKYDYVQVFEALVHNREVAENVFARCAKRHFRSEIANDLKLVMPEDAGELSPVWVVDSRVLLPVVQSDTEAATAAMFIVLAEELKNLVTVLAQDVVVRRRENTSTTLIGPLTTKVSEVGENLFSFSVKQKWSFCAK